MIHRELGLSAASLVFFFCAIARGQPVPCTDAAFDHLETPSPINGLWNLDVGDLDGDGDLDLATVGIYDGGAFAVYKNRGDGTFDEPAMHVIGEDPRCILLRDVDGDSDLDLIVANSEGQQLFIYLNSGNGVFDSPDSVYNFPQARPLYFVAADLDGDGDLDVAVSEVSNVELLWNRGDGYFDFGPSYPLGYGGSEIVAADFDGDCDLDLAGLDRTNYLLQDRVCVLHNDGSGGFGDRQCYPVPSWSTLALAAADVDGDGEVDLAGTNEPNARPNPVGMWVVFNDGMGHFDSAIVYPVGYWPDDVQFADLDRDGDLDAVVANENAFQFYPPPHDVSILLNRGDGTFEPEKRYLVGEEPIAVMPCDLDGDLDLDIAVANFGWYGPSTISTLINLHDPRADADCDDGIACTIDRCALGQGCRNYLDDTFCDDGLFCNGMERCVAAVGCEPAAGPPCAPEECDERNDRCLGHPPCEPEWTTGFGLPGINGTVRAMAVFNNALYVAGYFSIAGNVPVSNIAKWDGSSWSAVGSGTNDFVVALKVFDDGGGPALYAGGQFTTAGGVAANYIAKWNGTSWSALGPGTGGPNYPSVWALTVFDDGSGPALYAGGQFTTAGGVAANYIAKWNGAHWSPLGLGTNKPVYALTVFNDDDGPALYAAGYFTTVEGMSTHSIAKWNGSTWSAIGAPPDADGHSEFIYALAVFDDGNGPAIYAGGQYNWTDGRDCENGPIFRKWRNGAWSPTGTSVGAPHYGFYDYGACVYDPADSIGAFALFDDGSGPALYVGGKFSIAGGVAVNSVAKWNGSSWSPLGSPVSPNDDVSYVLSLTAFDDGKQPAALYAGGSFNSVGGVGANSIAAWTGAKWTVLGTGLDDSVRALTVFDDGGGAGLYAGGYFLSAGGSVANYVSKWDGSSWSPLGSGMDDLVDALTVFDDGSGPALYAGGWFTTADGATSNHIAKWNPGEPGNWSAIGTGQYAWWGVVALTVSDVGTGPALYAGGYLSTGNAPQVIRWDGSTWSALPAGTAGIVNVFALASFDDGGGPGLYVGGNGSWGLAKWDGSSWSKLGTGVNGPVTALTVFDDGAGPALYAGGWFTKAGGVSANYIAKWNGTSWSPLGIGMNSAPYVLTVLDDGGGPSLYAGGYFTTAGGVEVNHIAMWNGINWSAVGTGMNDAVLALAAFNDAHGPALYAGGPFTTAGDDFSAHLAKWACVRRGDMNQDSVVDLSDYVMFSDCLGGPSQTLEVALCASGDIDSDGDIDLLDVAAFQSATGQ